MAIYCPECGMELPDGVAFCDACGTPLRGTQQGPRADGSAGSGHLGSVVCPICAAAAMPGEAFCDNCGASLLAPTTYVSPASPAKSAQPASASPANTQPTAAGQSSARQMVAQLVVTSPPPPATIPLPGRTEIIVGRSDPQSNSYPDS